LAHLIGTEGVTITDLRPAGKATFDDAKSHEKNEKRQHGEYDARP
jgi:hypothetical protein